MPRSGEYDTTYVSKLKNIGIVLLEPFSGAKKHHQMKCVQCNHIWSSTPLSKIQNYKKWSKGGCPQCTSSSIFTERRRNNLRALKNRGLIVQSDYDGRYALADGNTPIRVEIRNIKCGHIFTTDSKNLLSRKVSCPICARELKTKNLNDSSKSRSNHWALSAPEWKRYRSEVTKFTKIAYSKHKSSINPNNLPTGRAGTEGAYHLDHIVPVRYCFDNSIPATICAHWSNLQMLGWRDNVGSRDKLKEGIKVPEIFEAFIS